MALAVHTWSHLRENAFDIARAELRVMIRLPELALVALTAAITCLACGGEDDPAAGYEELSGATGEAGAGGSAGGDAAGGAGGDSAGAGGDSAGAGGSPATGGAPSTGGAGGSSGQSESGSGGGGGTTGPRCGGTCDVPDIDAKFNLCTCDPTDPCGWKNNGICEHECIDSGIVTTSFDDSDDCVQCTLSDDAEPNDTLATATEVGGDGIITDCEGWKTATGAIESTTDEDWFAYEGDDAPCGLDNIAPHIKLEGNATGLQVCVFAKPYEAGDVPECSKGTESSMAGGYYGCCAADEARLALPTRFGEKDNASVRMRVRSSGSTSCMAYEISFGYGWL